MPRGFRCQAHKHTSVAPEENHHLRPLSRGGLTVPSNMRYLCSNAHSDAHYLLDLIEKHATRMIGSTVPVETPYESIPWDDLKTYGTKIRAAALEGWTAYGAAFLRGDYRKHAALWSTSGQPRPDVARQLARIGRPQMRVPVGAPVFHLPYALAAEQTVDLEDLIAQL